MFRSRRELSNEYLLAKIGVDTAENEPLEVWGKIFNIIHWCPYSRRAASRPAAATVGRPAPSTPGLDGGVTGLRVRLGAVPAGAGPYRNTFRIYIVFLFQRRQHQTVFEIRKDNSMFLYFFVLQ